MKDCVWQWGYLFSPENKPVHLTQGVEASNISEKYYEPPLMQVIPSACEACEERGYEVSNMCKGCLAHPCAGSLSEGRNFHGGWKIIYRSGQSALSVENASLPVHMTQLQKKNVHVKMHVELEQLYRIKWEELILILTSVYHAVCVW